MPVLVGILVGSLVVSWLRRASQSSKPRQKPIHFDARSAPSVFMSQLRPYLV